MDIDVVDKLPPSTRSNDLEELRERIRGSRVNVVILDLDNDEIPSRCGSLLQEFPGVVIVGVADYGRRTVLYGAIHVDDIGIAELLRTIRAAAGHHLSG